MYSLTCLTKAELAKVLGKKSKYRNLRTSCGEHQHASKKEAIRCGELQLMVKGKRISGLEQQPQYKLEVNGHPICTYRADFAYHDLLEKADVVEDCKGMKTDVYKLKKKLMWACLGIAVKET